MTIKILFIENDSDLARSVKTYFRKAFDVTIALSGKDGLKKFKNEKYNLVMLDLNLPDVPGLQVCQEMRDIEKETPILVLTGIVDSEVQIELLDAGADDYVTKPFNGRQLKARIDALLRRTGLTNQSILTTHDLVIDTQKRHVTRAGINISLRRKEYDILEYLVRNKGQIITRTMIFDNIWEKEVRPNSIDVHIKHLRDKIDRPFDMPLIETKHGFGYCIKDLPPQ